MAQFVDSISVKGLTFGGEKLEQCLIDTCFILEFFFLQKILKGEKQIVIG